MPSHEHKIVRQDGAQLSTWQTNASGGSAWDMPADGATAGHMEYYTTWVGGTNAHNNIPPYLSVYMWKRTS